MEPAAPDAAPVSPAAAQPKASRVGTKQDALIAMLRRPDGASIDEIIAATGWQPHTVRGAISGALKKKLGLAVASDKVEGRGRVYRLPNDRHSTSPAGRRWRSARSRPPMWRPR